MRMQLTILALALTLLAVPAADASPTFKIAIKQHSFVPETLTVPADVRIKLLVKNTRNLPSEFESFDLDREQLVPSGGTITVWIGPLSIGKYKFFDDFNPGVTGWIEVSKTVKPAQS